MGLVDEVVLTPGTREATVSVVFKIASKCNLNCTYCYVYNSRDKAYLTQPRFMSEEVLDGVVRFFAEGAPRLGLKNVQFIFHGGEPLLAGTERLDGIAQRLQAGLVNHVAVSFALQTNATLVDDAWISTFEKRAIAIGVSLDGPAQINDRRRVTLTNKGSHARAAAGIQRLVRAHDARRIPSLGLLCVIDPAQNPRALFDHFVDDLGVRLLDFLLPDVTHEDAVDVDGIGAYLVELFDHWTERNDPGVKVRVLSSVLSLLLGGRSRMIGFGKEQPLAITINTDGSLSPDDTLRACGSSIMETGHNVLTSTFDEFISSNTMTWVRGEISNTPAACRGCEWERICGGSHLINRFSPHNGFANPSVLCSSLQRLYSRVAAFLLAHGHYDRVLASLLHPTAATTERITA